MLKIAHIINPVLVPKTSDLHIAQPITFESMRIAREHAHHHAEVDFFSSQFEQDIPTIPNTFIQTPNLTRSIMDIKSFATNRKLPILKDILDRLYEASPDADYLIYTNVDIALMPNFYIDVSKIIEQGYDSFVINRRTITKDYTRIEDLPLMYAQEGAPHPGYDCFILKRNLYPKFNLGNTCIGTRWVGRNIIINLIRHSNKFKIFEDLHLTFHIGNDRIWDNNSFRDYAVHNQSEARRILLGYQEEDPDFSRKPLISEFLSDSEKPIPRKKGKLLRLIHKMLALTKSLIKSCI